MSLLASLGPSVDPIALVGLGGVLTALVWYIFGTPYAIAVGHVVLMALFPDGIDPLSFVLAETVFLAMLLVAAIRTSRPIRFASVAIVATLVLAGTAWVTLETQTQTQPLWVAAVALVGVGCLAVYGLHRYELVRLGLVSEAAESVESADPGSGTDRQTTTGHNTRGRIRQ
ncbi:hypothetical protein OB955_10750 [Halobacteria archaeon AArc-m2/3/4]|uniref:DUF8163 domain-containing protein n=1 Tax=Natronoglomus mannanivorans TaxID=2979990 RepID=A0AAP2YXX4_9EURY|nr:hypothetical protein [Halobacteria archaeon AArc-xg1-1]MCU4973221.1 hypothetical protein [Halobacteria archaeon AArc-m2/3/4]